jgi:nickel/cobalt exporter
MLEGILYLLSSFWFGALHAATPGHGKTVTAAYLVGVRGRIVDALALGIVVTLSHTGGVVVFGIIATLTSAALLPQVIEPWVALVTGITIVVIGVSQLWALRPRRAMLVTATTATSMTPAGYPAGMGGAASLAGPSGDGLHSHGLWSHRHIQVNPAQLANRPSFGLLVALGVAGGIMPDPGALAVLLSAIASGRLMLGLATVLVYSLGFAAVLVLVGVLAARAGSYLLARIGDGRWIGWLNIGASAVITVVGLVLTINALRLMGLGAGS